MFFDREKEKKELKAILSGEPNLIYFVYGPINSGKTALIMEVLKELPEEYAVFYINFRGRDVQTTEDLIKTLFRVKRGKTQETKEFVKEVLKSGAKLLEKLKGIPIPESTFELLFKRKDKIEDIFAFLEDYFAEIKKQERNPVFILDEIQTIKEVVNQTGKPVLSGLFNFLVRLTKETHLCHSLCATSDCLFIEEIYANARLEGRAKYILVDDLEKERALKIYEDFGFKEKELIWDYIGGKLGDMISLFEEKKRSCPEKEALERMLNAEKGRLKWIRFKMLKSLEEKEKIWSLLERFRDTDTVGHWSEEEFGGFIFWIEQNVLFYNPLDSVIRPQGRLIWKAIKEIINGCC